MKDSAAPWQLAGLEFKVRPFCAHCGFNQSLGLQRKSKKSMSTFLCWVGNNRTGPNVLGYDYQERNTNLNRKQGRAIRLFSLCKKSKQGWDHPWLETRCSVESSPVSWHSYTSATGGARSGAAGNKGSCFLMLPWWAWVLVDPRPQALSVLCSFSGIRQNSGLLVNA